MPYPLKLIIVGLAALLATLSSFLLMQFLIDTHFEQSTSDPMLNFHPARMDDIERRPLPEPRPKPRKLLPMQLPSDTLAKQAIISFETEIIGDMNVLDVPDDVALLPVAPTVTAPIQDFSPISVIEPIYPLEAVVRQVEGFVIVQFGIREDGTVQNPLIIEAVPSGVFEEATLLAVNRFLFRPRTISGDPVMVPEVLLRFTYRLEDRATLNRQEILSTEAGARQNGDLPPEGPGA